ncbi:hypothetical protein [Paenibacillus nuruki]|uniref:hypothetical protein n=1 Tax=Paenibacillus nuruki TaxID=1886670 RepID=UPI002804960F|nr:hypothetical protein [Paenibacillus nuruki]CAJ1315937.1 hypothetical protein AASFL403_11995 [Paenibacillus nuruki]
MPFRYERKDLSKPVQAMLNQRDKANKELRKSEEQIIDNPVKYANSKGWKEIKLEINFDDGHVVHADFIAPEEINNYIKFIDNIKFKDELKNPINGEASFTREGLMHEYGKDLDYLSDKSIGFDMKIIKRK